MGWMQPVALVIIDSMTLLRSLETLALDNSYARLPEAFYARVNPTPFTAPPFLISANPSAMALLDLDPGGQRR